MHLEKPEGKRLLERLRSRRKDNIKMGLPEMVSGTWTESMWPRTETGGGLL
jgi:hypothetical protein